MVSIAFTSWQRSLKHVPPVQFPVVQLPAPNAFDTFIAAGKVYVKAETPVDIALDRRPPLTGTKTTDYKREYDPAAREAWLAKNEQSLRLLRQGLNQRYLHPLYLSSNYELKHIDSFRDLANLLAVEHRARALRGDWSGAAQSALDLLQFGATVPRGAPLLVAYGGYRAQALGRSLLPAALPHLDLQSARHVLARLNEIDSLRVPFSETLEIEKVLNKALLIDLMKSGNWQSSFFSEQSKAAFRWKLLKMNYPLILADNQRFFDEAIAASKAGKVAVSSIAAYACTEADPVICRVAPVFFTAGSSAALCQAGNNLLRTAVALRVYFLDNGRYPHTLSALVPQYLKAVPADPYHPDKPLSYRAGPVGYAAWDYQRLAVSSGQTTNTAVSEKWVWQGKLISKYVPYTLYSVGPDGADNSGQPIEDKNINGGGRYEVSVVSSGDMVAGVNW